MKAAILDQQVFDFVIGEVPIPEVAPSHVLIRLKAASLNHHELWSVQEKSVQADSPIIMGSDGSGVIAQVGDEIEHWKIGDEVVINPSLNWGANEKAFGVGYEILGFPTQGTFAEYIALDAQYVYPKPGHLSFEEAAALPLAGLTAYRALHLRGEFNSGDTVLLTGIGGGVALFALTFAVAQKGPVFVTSGDKTKIELAVKLGAVGGANYKDESWSKELFKGIEGFDVIIDSAAGKDFSMLTDLAKPGGRIVLLGRTAGMITTLNPRTIFLKQLSIHGTTMGNHQDFLSMLDLVSSKKIKPIIDSVYSLENIGEGFKRMESGQHFGKIVIRIE